MGRPIAHDREGNPAYPVLRSGGGGGSSGTWRMSYWLWPPPPPGPLTWVAVWPEVGLGETSVEVDASILAEAANEAEQLWEEDESRAPRGYTPMTSSLAVAEGQHSIKQGVGSPAYKPEVP